MKRRRRRRLVLWEILSVAFLLFVVGRSKRAHLPVCVCNNRLRVSETQLLSIKFNTTANHSARNSDHAESHLWPPIEMAAMLFMREIYSRPYAYGHTKTGKPLGLCENIPIGGRPEEADRISFNHDMMTA